MFICNSLAIYTPHPHGLSRKCRPFFTPAQAWECSLKIAPHTNKTGGLGKRKRLKMLPRPKQHNRRSATNETNASFKTVARQNTTGIFILAWKYCCKLPSNELNHVLLLYHNYCRYCICNHPKYSKLIHNKLVYY